MVLNLAGRRQASEASDLLCQLRLLHTPAKQLRAALELTACRSSQLPLRKLGQSPSRQPRWSCSGPWHLSAGALRTLDAAQGHRAGLLPHRGYSSGRAESDLEPKPYYVTTPIFYVNADPHIGHLHSCLIADVLARYHNLRSGGCSLHDRRGHTISGADLEGVLSGSFRVPSILSTGTDEHGLKIQKVAEALGEDPQRLCDRISRRFKDLADAADVQYHRFIRTTDHSHRNAVHSLWNVLKSKGLIYKGTHEGWYAVSDEAFYPDNQVREVIDEQTGGRYMECIETGSKVEWSSEENYKFKLSAFRDDLIRWLESDPNAIRPARRHEQVLDELKSGLSDLSISRPSSRLSWGIPVPDDPDHSIYVWLDALTNYLTVAGFPWDGSDGAAPGNRAWPADVHVVGKDIIRFHAIYWPAFLLGAGLPLPKTILAHAHWTMNKSKMSKSKGNVANPFDAIKMFGLDTIRFFLMRVGGNIGTDSDYSPAVLMEYHRKYLQGQLGNLLSRISAPKIHARLAGFLGPESSEVSRLAHSAVSPLLDKRTLEMKTSFETSLISLPGQVDDLMSRYEFSKVLELILEDIIGRTNELLQHLEPWSPKTPEPVVLEAVVLVSESLRITATLLRPFMPRKMDELMDALQVEPDRRSSWNDLVRVDQDGRLRASIKIREASAAKLKPLFPAIEVEAA